MIRKRLTFKGRFSVALENSRAQAAAMALSPGETEGGSDNQHRGSDQWMYVVSGTGTAVVDGRRQALREGTLLLIERGVTHEIRNLGRTPLKTLSFSCPPAYTKCGNPLPAGRA